MNHHETLARIDALFTEIATIANDIEAPELLKIWAGRKLGEANAAIKDLSPQAPEINGFKFSPYRAAAKAADDGGSYRITEPRQENGSYCSDLFSKNGTGEWWSTPTCQVYWTDTGRFRSCLYHGCLYGSDGFVLFKEALRDGKLR